MAATCFCTRPGCGRSFPGTVVPEHDPECTAWHAMILKPIDPEYERRAEHRLNEWIAQRGENES